MRTLLRLATLAALSSPVWGGDTVITTQKHADAVNTPAGAQPAKDTIQVMWIGKDHLRMEEDTSVTIVRADLKKMYMLDTAARTVTTVDLPFDMKKYMPPEMAGHIDQMMASMAKPTLTPSTETQKVKDWNATKYTLTQGLPMGGSLTQVMWITKDLAADRSGWMDMCATMQGASNPFASGVAAEMRKIDGYPVLVERTMVMMGNEQKSKEEVTSIETKDAPAGHYEVPADYTEKPFDAMAGMGGPGHGPGRGPRRG